MYNGTMDGVGKLDKFKRRGEKNKQYLHSPSHVLADELATKLNDKKHFGFYLKTALSTDHAVLHKIVGEILESKTVRSPGKLFAYLLKKYNQENSSK